jgi:hypothetical protein
LKSVPPAVDSQSNAQQLRLEMTTHAPSLSALYRTRILGFCNLVAGVMNHRQRA